MHPLSKGPFKHAERKELGTDACTEPPHQELMRMLRARIRIYEA
jgi:hypothetical protein